MRRSSSDVRVSGADTITNFERARQRLDRTVDVVVRDVEMHDGPHDRRMDGVGDPDALGYGTCLRLLPGECEGRDVDLDEVRLGLRRIDRHPGRCPALGEPTGAGMVVRDPLDVVLERVDTGSGDDPGLAHRASEEVLATPGG